MFYTRIPCPAWVDHSEHYLSASLKYLPAIGWIVGGYSAAVFYGAQLVLPVTVSLLLSMIAGILITGAFHEDGLADVCDAFGGGWTKEDILTIMKDSRVGAYGVIGMILLLLLKFAALLEIATIGLTVFVPVLILAHAVSRFVALTFVQTHTYARDDASTKSRPVVTRRLRAGEISFSVLLALAPFGLMKPLWLIVLMVPAYLAKALLGSYFNKRIGGYTGDCIGATQQLCEVTFYISFLILWNFI
ncbi:MAG TPA: adenosylcobinamide-GDP ribazoletransferase [Bacteroidota bacterium]